MNPKLAFPSLIALCLLLLLPPIATAQRYGSEDKFRQLGEELPTPNVYRNAAGAPGHQYWQQRADYDMKITLDDDTQRIYGEETITYHNASPDALAYLWLQLDQNMRAKDSDTYKTQSRSFEGDRLSLGALKQMHDQQQFDGGFKIEYVRDASGAALPHTINQTMMRVDLPQPLESGESYAFQVKWWYNINDRIKLNGRSGYEYFAEDGNYLYTIAQFFPRMAMYNEIYGWQHKQFLGQGEFTLCFGDYKVSLTVPDDHVVASTGTLQNPDQVLSAKHKKLFEKAYEATTQPVIIVTEEEARAAEKKKSKSTRTWLFEAENVRDFAFASSRKFIWDAMAVKMGDRTVLAMSYYPKEGNPLWEQYSTKSVAHTLRVYSKYTFDYPYPVAISVHTDQIGMEYPMICFNGGRPNGDGTYGERTKYGLISVVIHEVGHNYFPMIVNSDERQWSWMDEGLNSFLQYLTEQEWERGYPSRRGPAVNLVDYMKSDKDLLRPIMTNSEAILRMEFGNNAYGKPATALNILRETVMGRELFDFAFKQYSQRWMFKHPAPADFFRTLEDASGVDLDWFWRGWFYTTDHVDIAIDQVKWIQLNTRDPEVEKPLAQKQAETAPKYISDIRNESDIPATYLDEDPSLADFYNRHDPFSVTILDRMEYQRYLQTLSPEEQAFVKAGYNFYEVNFSNIGGLVMPIILEFTYSDGSTEIQRIPAEIWRLNHERASRIFITDKQITGIVLDPHLETADTDTGNNYWPPRAQPTRFELFRSRFDMQGENPMQKAQRAAELEKRTGKDEKKPAAKGNDSP